MLRRAVCVLGALVLSAAACRVAVSAPLVLIQDGEARAQIWHRGDAEEAAADLADHLEKISGAALGVNVIPEGMAPPEGAPAIVLGRAALELGLPEPPKTISGDGYRILRRGNRLLMAGESAQSTMFATSHFLETLGCRWFFSNELGTVIPQMQTVSVDELDVAEQPDFVSRSLWGPNWRDRSWQLHNRLGGLSMPTGHDWGYVPADTYWEEHPEYYSLRGGERRRGNWLCTSNPDVVRIFARGVAEQVRGKGPTAVSISPPDGTGYCQCEACRALDEPGYLEPSSGRVAVSDRYMEFFKAVAAQVQEVNPEAILNFYAYADYSLPPRRVRNAPENLCAWIAPIRFCRLHSMSNPLCESRQRLRRAVGQWQQAVSKIGWREYNYNLAELTVPFSKKSIWKDDIPYLHHSGCLGLNIECLFLWHIYGPHTYLIARLAWDADADVDAIMDDFYTKFCGTAAPHVKAYWERIDRAYRETDIHVGSFYGLHAIWTPEVVRACEADLAAAAQAADSDLVRRRVEMFRMGFENVRYFLQVRQATNECDFARARELFDRWLEHMDRIHASGIHRIAEYKRGYAPRFLGAAVQEGYERTTGACRKVVQLPDEWLFRYDPEGVGEQRGWHRETLPPDQADGWQKVRTYSATITEQGIPEQLTWMWYRTEFPCEVPPGQRLYLWFAEVDGRPTRVFLNGELLGETRNSRRPFEFEVTGKLRHNNVVAVRIDHHRISELSLGGLIKPVMVYSAPAEGPAGQ